MSQTYNATGINLKSIPLGESDRILTILTRECGLIRVVAPGSRKPKAKLGGRGEIFVVNHLMLSKGKSLDKIAQAESIESYPALSRNLAKLTVGQYWAEMVLNQTSSHETNGEVFDWLCQRLSDLASCKPGLPVLIHLVYGVVQLLHLGGILPQVDRCCLTDLPVDAEAIGNGKVVFSPASGGVVLPSSEPHPPQTALGSTGSRSVQEQPRGYDRTRRRSAAAVLSAFELMLMQQLFRVQEALPQTYPPPQELIDLADTTQGWLKIEQALRNYVQYHTNRPIRSAALLDCCFLSDSIAVSAVRP